ncbi:MAG: phosphoribosylanthranilate isomerase [Gammaproteobacteria bacterium]|nr:phosphoribosylanthranilate isomerase [Gammaproteobacteria bacterium]
MPRFSGMLGMADIWIKICGIARAEDARAAAALGADAIGIVCYPPSRRYVPLGRIREVLGGLAAETGAEAKQVETIALFVNPSRDAVREVLECGLFSGLQFHGEESAGFCESFGLPYMKALRVRGGEEALLEIGSEIGSEIGPAIGEYPSAGRILLDAWDSAGRGGTGKTFRWEVAEKLVAAGARNIVIAGGLGAGNVARAVRQVRPFGVDVSSGVESAPGVKSMDKMAQFIEEVRDA